MEYTSTAGMEEGFMKPNFSSARNASSTTFSDGDRYSNAGITAGGNASIFPEFPLEEHGRLIFDDPTVRILFAVIYSVVFALCFFGNLAVLLVVVLHWRMRSITKFFLGNLAFADLCVGIFCIYQNLSTYFMDSWMFGDFLCKMYHFINSLSHTASILILVVICVERYLVLLHPFKYRRILSIHRLRMIILLVWALSALLCSPRLYFIQTMDMEIQGESEEASSLQETICIPVESVFNSRTADIIYFLILFVIPLGVITYLHTRIGIFLAGRGRHLQAGSARDNCMSGEPHYPNSNEDTGPKFSSNSLLPLQQSTRRSGGNHRGKKYGKTATIDAETEEDISSTSTSGFTYVDLRKPKTNYSCIGESGESSSGNFRENYRASCDFVQDEIEFLRRENWRENPSKKRDFSSKRRIDRKLGNIDRKISRPHRQKNFSRLGQPQRRDLQLTSSFLRPGEISPELIPIRAVTASMNVQRNNGRIAKARIRRGGMMREIKGNHEGRISCNSTKASARLSRMERRMKSQSGAVRMLCLIVVTFALCNFPYHLRKLCQTFWTLYDYDSDASHIISALTHLLQYINCAVNPILYGFTGKIFRASFVDVVRCRWRRKLYRSASFRFFQ